MSDEYDFLGAVNRLKKSPLFAELRTTEQEFNLFVTLGVAHREISHSHLLAWLLGDPEFVGFRASFVEFLADRASSLGNVQLANRLRSIPSDRSPKMYRELGRIDVLADFGPDQVSIGIENKIWAVEQDKQLERYQRFLLVHCHSRKQMGVIAFLTPSGAMPVTEDPTHVIPVISLSWQSLLGLLQGQPDPTSGSLREFKQQMEHHIREDIMGDTKERRIVKTLLRDSETRKVIRKIVENLPTLADFEGDWMTCVQRYAGSAQPLQLERYREKGELKEIKIYVERWKRHRLPICFMLYNYDDQAGVRTWIYDKDLEDTATYNELQAFAAGNVDVVNPRFPKIQGWAWHEVFVGDNDDDHTPLSILDDNFIELAATVFQEQFDRIAPLVETWVQTQSG